MANLYDTNWAAIADVDPKLAKEIAEHRETSANEEPISQTPLEDKSKKKLKEVLLFRTPLAFGGLQSVYALMHCLDNQVHMLHGMTRAHYFFEPSIKALVRLCTTFDFSEYLKTQELIIFGGSCIKQQMKKVFGTLRYLPPHLSIGDTALVSRCLDDYVVPLANTGDKEKAEKYYKSEEFAQQRQLITSGIVTGKISAHGMPRVLIRTSRWTTFLKYCAADFDKGFTQLGCDCFYLIEENDVQSITAALEYKIIADFKPDVVFIVTHARLSLLHLPKGLPIIGYIQDKCGPILHTEDMSEKITEQDLFVCGLQEFKRYLVEKKVPEKQTVILPPPANPEVFYPDNLCGLAGGIDGDRKWVDIRQNEISFVKHGHQHFEDTWKEFRQQWQAAPQPIKHALNTAFKALYEKFCFDGVVCHYEDEMQEFIKTCDFPEEIPAIDLESLVAQFYITCFSNAWRCRFLEALQDAGLPLKLYGLNWDKHKTLKKSWAGVVDHTEELNAIYNKSAINLSINHCCTMHQRLSECGLAGGFMMVAMHPADRDWEPSGNYFGFDTEISGFSTPEGLVDQCEFWLRNSERREVFAAAMHERAIKERTCKVAAEIVLNKWKELL